MKAKIRISEANWNIMRALLLRNFPDVEHATFFECGWIETPKSLILSVTSLHLPSEQDITCGPSAISLHESYSLRQALNIEKSGYASGLVHSHPQGWHVEPSRIDNNMDSYYSEYFDSFTPGRPFISMIYSEDEIGRQKFSGRVFWKEKWIECVEIQIIGEAYQKLPSDIVEPVPIPKDINARLERLTGVMGMEAAKNLWRSKVGIIGGGGTGSALFHSLARACVGTIVTVDYDILSPSNTERIHGVRQADLLVGEVFKVDILKRLAADINPDITVIPIRANANTTEVIRELVDCDIVFGCTDTQVGKVLVSNLATQYLVPTIHVNVSMETVNGRLAGQIVQINQYTSGLSCVYCRDLINAQLLTQEMMSNEERLSRIESARNADKSTRSMYWIDEPVVHTVGALTTIAAEYASTFGIGLLTGAYQIKEEYLELNTMKPSIAPVTQAIKKKANCICTRRHEGYSEQGDGWL